MEEFFEPNYQIDLDDDSTRKRIRMAKAGERLKVNVRPTGGSVSALEATATRSQDGTQFNVRLICVLGFQDIGYDYHELVDQTYEQSEL